MVRVFGSAKRQFGDQGEKLAEAYLRRKGYRIVARNVTALRLGELDLIATHHGTLIFIEVKTRRSGRFGTPEEGVSPPKLEKLSRAIHWYLQEKGLERAKYRLDIIAIEYIGPKPEIRHLKGIGLS